MEVVARLPSCDAVDAAEVTLVLRGLKSLITMTAKMTTTHKTQKTANNDCCRVIRSFSGITSLSPDNIFFSATPLYGARLTVER